MKRKSRFSKILAVVCAISLVANSSMIQSFAGTEDNDEFLELTFNDFGMKGIYDGTDEIPLSLSGNAAGVNTMDNVAFSGKVTFQDTSETIATAVYDSVRIGGLDAAGSWLGLTIFYDGTNLVLQDYTSGGPVDMCTVTEAQAGQLTDTPLDIRLTCRYENVNDAHITFSVGGTTYYDDIRPAIADKLGAWMAVTSYVRAITVESVYAEDTTEYDEKTLSDFAPLSSGTIGESVAADPSGSAGEGTLENIAIDGIYHMSASGNMIFFGGAWTGLYMQSNAGQLLFRYMSNGVDKQLGAVTAADAGLTSLTGTDLRVRISFAFSNKTETTADLRIGVKLGNRYQTYYNIQNANLSVFQKTVMLYAPAGMPMTYRSVVIGEEAQYDVKTLSDFAPLEDGTIGESVAADPSGSAGAGTLENIAVDAIYDFSDSGNMIFFGGAYKGFYLQSHLGDILCRCMDGGVDRELGKITASDVEVDSLTEPGLRIRVAFLFTEKTETTADVQVEVKVGDNYTTYFAIEDMNQTSLQKVVMLYAAAGNPLSYESIAKEPVVFTELTLDTYGLSGLYDGTDETPISIAGQAITISNLDKVAISGKITFQETDEETPHPEYDSLRIGGLSSGGSWLALTLFYDGTNLVLRDYTSGAPVDLCTITAEQAGTLTDTPLDIRFTCQYVGVNDAQITFSIGATEYYNGTLTNVADKLGTWAAVTSYVRAVTLGELPGDDDEDIEVPEEIVKPALRKVTLKQLGITEAVYKYNNNDLLVSANSSQSLMNTVFATKITFSNHPNLRLMYAGGPSAWHGINFSTYENGNILIHAGATEFAETYWLTPEIAGTDLIGKEIELKIELFESADDVILGVYINGELYDGDYFRLSATAEDATGVADNLGTYIGFYSGNEEGSITLGVPEPMPLVDTSFTKLTFDSYGLESGTYGYNNNDLAVSGKIKSDSLDRVVFSDTVQFSREAGATLRIGGKPSAWHGLILSNTEDGKLMLNEAEGKIPTIYFDPATAGTELTGKDIKLTLSFEYVDSDEDGNKDDVKLGVWFNGKAYGDRWIYLQDIAELLGGYISIYCSNENASLKIETYNVPIDFTIWGFTIRWAYELGLRKA